MSNAEFGKHLSNLRQEANLAKQLRLAGILPQDLTNFQIIGDSSKHVLKLYLQDGSSAQLSSILTTA